MVAVLFASLVFSCKKVSPKGVEKTVTEGSWKITLFSEDGVNETNDFTGYSFVFSKNGQVTAANGTVTMNGTWSSSDSNSNDDSSNETHFNLYFEALNNFDELADDWHVVSLSSSKIELEDESGDGSIDLLTFEKI